MFLSTKDEPNVLKSLEKEVILFLKSLWKTTVGFLYEAWILWLWSLSKGRLWLLFWLSLLENFGMASLWQRWFDVAALNISCSYYW